MAEAEKGQDIRLLDVFLIGPLMIWAGYRLRKEPLGLLLMGAGAGTIILNYSNYVKTKKAAEGTDDVKLLVENV